jgi:hypothetical protein
MLKISKNSDPNYLAVVISCPKLTSHPNADKLEIVNIFGNDIIVAKGYYKENDTLIYFPVESTISDGFLSWSNLFDDPLKNSDKQTKSYFGKHGRVKAISLRGIPSQGFVCKTSTLSKYYNIDESIFNVGVSFDMVGDDVLLKKYIKPFKNISRNEKKIPSFVERIIDLLPKPMGKVINQFLFDYLSIIDGQFKFHYSTEHLGKNIHLVNPDDEIVILSKLHGASAIYGNLLCRKPFNPLRDIINKLGDYLPSTHYKFIYSSRNVIKNLRDDTFTSDIWGDNARVYKSIIPEGITVYGEIVGWTGINKYIQSNYDYGVKQGESKFYVYRVTYTEVDGEVYEYSWNEIEDFCIEHNMDTVPLYYKGAANCLFDIVEDDKWHDNFLHALKEKYLDKVCELCKTDVVNEGIVLRIDSHEKRPTFKFKSPKFLIGESLLRDKGEDDMEEDN